MKRSDSKVVKQVMYLVPLTEIISRTRDICIPHSAALVLRPALRTADIIYGGYYHPFKQDLCSGNSFQMILFPHKTNSLISGLMNVNGDKNSLERTQQK